MANVRNIFDLSPKDFFKFLMDGTCRSAKIKQEEQWIPAILDASSITYNGNVGNMEQIIFFIVIPSSPISDGSTFISFFGKEIPCSINSYENSMEHGVLIKYEQLIFFTNGCWSDASIPSSLKKSETKVKKIIKKMGFFDLIDLDG